VVGGRGSCFKGGRTFQRVNHDQKLSVMEIVVFESFSLTKIAPLSSFSRWRFVSTRFKEAS
jgi:hypothetical protein